MDLPDSESSDTHRLRPCLLQCGQSPCEVLGLTFSYPVPLPVTPALFIGLLQGKNLATVVKKLTA